MPGDETPSDVFTVLLVCTGNICQSALAERLGRAYLDEVLGADAGLVRMHSAGTGAVVGSGMHPDSALVLEGLGGDPAAFVARQLQPAYVEDADLILALTRANRRDVLQLVPRALARTFTLREAASLLDVRVETGRDGGAPPERGRQLVRNLATARSRHTGTEDDDVPGPINRPLEAHQEAGELIAAALIPLLQRIVERADNCPGDAQGDPDLVLPV